MKFKITITATLDIPIADLREEISAEEDDVPSADLAGAVQEYINDNLTSLGIEAGDTEIGAVEVKKA
jgi:hypothetical protein